MNKKYIESWIGHLKYVKQHPNKEDSDEFYQDLIDKWEAKLREK